MTAGTLATRFRRKVVLYATWRDRLLVFSEPDFPEAGVQVPGGTVMDGETIEDGAWREFREETGFEAADLHLLGQASYIYQDRRFRHEHARSYFHLPLEGTYPATWEWVEQTPDGGDGPIRMAFFFVSVTAIPELFGGLGAFLPQLLARMEALDGMARPMLGHRQEGHER